jgi:hypothetical protein
VSWFPPPNLRPSTGVLLLGHGVVMGRIRKEAARKDALLGIDDKIQEERLRFAQRLVQELREAGYEVSEDGLAWALKPLN